MDFGGEMKFSFGGTRLTMRGDFNTEPSNVSAEEIVNQDNSTSRSFKPKGYKAETKFEDTAVGAATSADWDGILRGGPYIVTVEETQTGVLHTWSTARFIGSPKVDRSKGEVTGLSIISDTYKRTSN